MFDGEWRRAELGVAFAAAVAVALVGVHPAPVLHFFPRYGFVVRHLPGRGLDGPDPIYTHVGYRKPTRVDTAAIRRAGRLLPDRALYYVRAGVDDRTSGDVTHAARLFFLPAVQSRRPQIAGWVLSYRAPPPAESRHVYDLDRGLQLIRVR